METIPVDVDNGRQHVEIRSTGHSCRYPDCSSQSTLHRMTPDYDLDTVEVAHYVLAMDCGMDDSADSLEDVDRLLARYGFERVAR